ncbi:hypothetical protein [Pantoea rodasii]|uniref:hypothetical protein n=1 Tax=Pantoea rodasii TaxID=1076549 RepID=UPI00142DF779|nr:hypothetical protein [Pantoea rodasii]
MNTLHKFQEQHDDVLDADDQHIITVNLPGRQAIYVIGQNDDDADMLLDVQIGGM